MHLRQNKNTLLPRAGHDDKQSEFDTAIIRVRVQFLKRLASSIEEIETTMDVIDEQGPLPHLVDSIRVHAHKIAGLAPTLGFQLLGNIAFETDCALATVIEPKNWPKYRRLVLRFTSQIKTTSAAASGPEHQMGIS